MEKQAHNSNSLLSSFRLSAEKRTTERQARMEERKVTSNAWRGEGEGREGNHSRGALTIIMDWLDCIM